MCTLSKEKIKARKCWIGDWGLLPTYRKQPAIPNPKSPTESRFFEHAGAKNKKNEQQDGYDKHRIKFF
jgi:hypothetical protein